MNDMFFIIIIIYFRLLYKGLHGYHMTRMTESRAAQALSVLSRNCIETDDETVRLVVKKKPENNYVSSIKHIFETFFLLVNHQITLNDLGLVSVSHRNPSYI